MVKIYAFLLFIVAFSSGINAQDTRTPEGRWETRDDETGEVKSVIEIYAEGDRYYGKVVEILTNNKDAVCEKCTGKDKDAPVLGLIVIKGLRAHDDYWKGGTILDPQKGAEYKLSAWFDAEDPNTLFIRGKHWTGLYRTQEWKRTDR